MHRTGKAHS